MDLELRLTLMCQGCGCRWDRTLRIPAGVAAPDPNLLSACVNCSQDRSMLTGMSEQQILKSKLARRVASGLKLPTKAQGAYGRARPKMARGE